MNQTIFARYNNPYVLTLNKSSYRPEYKPEYARFLFNGDGEYYRITLYQLYVNKGQPIITRFTNSGGIIALSQYKDKKSVQDALNTSRKYDLKS